MSDFMILASALASIVALISLARIAGQVDKIHELITVHQKINRGELEVIRRKVREIKGEIADAPEIDPDEIKLIQPKRDS